MSGAGPTQAARLLSASGGSAAAPAASVGAVMSGAGPQAASLGTHQ